MEWYWFLISWFGCGLISWFLSFLREDEITIRDLLYIPLGLCFGYIMLVAVLVLLFTEKVDLDKAIWERKK